MLCYSNRLSAFTVFLITLCYKGSVEHHLVIIVNGIYHLLSGLLARLVRSEEKRKGRLRVYLI